MAAHFLLLLLSVTWMTSVLVRTSCFDMNLINSSEKSCLPLYLIMCLLLHHVFLRPRIPYDPRHGFSRGETLSEPVMTQTTHLCMCHELTGQKRVSFEDHDQLNKILSLSLTFYAKVACPHTYQSKKTITRCRAPQSECKQQQINKVHT